ncbi:MAG TPA: hypothetical protein VG820_13645 [Fimbriimonadaceae bacterium]|nr:hypothetical protein [Fimbriimonadaceae bacterium]
METQAAEQVHTERSGVGMTIGVITFLLGVGLLLLTFKLAYDMFTVPPSHIISSTAKDQTVDLRTSGDNLVNVVVRVLLLVVMGLMGSLIANRGISLFTGSRRHRHRG